MQLTNRTGKKRQFEIAKKILKEENKDAAFFFFYDDDGNFRFSLIRVNFLGAKRDFTDFKRYTYFVSPKQTNKTFINQITRCDFNSLDSIQEAFSVEPITKQFYEKLQRWYFWAIKNVKFPDDAEQETNGREVAIIRLITRLMFIWFMKVRNLIPAELFDEENISKILKDFSEEESTYYKAILQNLFFATLNTKQEERKFRSEIRGAKGYNPDYGNHNVFRYQSLFSDSALLEKLFGKIPFLNGGLFECLDYKTKDKNERKYIDGFTATKENQPIVPNALFFSEIQKVDISSFFGVSKKTYEVEGLIDLLNSYNFTIDENEPDDIEVALDPELLGSIFENLLASYNPETATTARKATGSFYTPREIVNYMTIESLKQYFKTNLESSSGIDEKIESLINAGSSDNPFDEETTKQLIKLINDLRVVDPAVGSGAFPMAMLNKLVFILSKLDPENRHWKQSQIDGVKKSVSDSVVQRKLIEQIERQFKEKNADYGRKLYLIEKCIYGVDIQQIAVEIAKLRFFISLLVDEKIDFNKPENNYGIEPLPNLEFKLMQGNSLISTYAGIDFNADKNGEIEISIKEKKAQIKETKSKQNEIQSEFIKILNAENKQDKKSKTKLEGLAKVINKLESDLKKLEGNKDNADSEEYKKLIKEFEELKNEYQNEPDNEIKKELRNKIDKAIIKIFEEKISEHFPELKRIEENAKLLPKEEQRQKYISQEKQKLTKKLGFDIEQVEKDLIAYTEGRKAKDFFLWNIYFAEVFSQKARTERRRRGGFDIVIANPPYLKERDNAHIFAPVNSSDFGKIWHQGKMDFWYYFLHKAIDIKNNKGVITFITARYWIQSSGATKLIKRIKDNLFFSSVLDIGKVKVFNSVVGQHMVAIYVSEECIKTVYKKIENTIDDIFASINTENISISYINTSRIIRNNEIKFTFSEVDFIKNNVILNLGDILDCSQGVVEAPDKISRKACLLKFVKDVSIGDGVFVVNQTEKSAKEFNENFIKPYLDPNAIGRYFINHSDEFLIYSDKSIKENIRAGKFKKIKEHLDKYKPYITSSNKPYGIHRPREQKYFENPKLICKGMFSYPDFTYDDENYYVGFSFTVMIQKDLNFLLKYVLAILNSKLAHYWFVHNGKQRGVGFDIGVKKFRQFPIIKADLSFQKKLEIVVDQVLASKKENLQADTSAKERQIDLMVYKLYDLTYDEVKIVEPAFALTKEEYENYE